MALGVTRDELKLWKERVEACEIAFLTHYWKNERFPGCKTVTKAGCADVEKLIKWGANYSLKPEWIDYKHYPHFDLFGDYERQILINEGQMQQYKRFYA